MSNDGRKVVVCFGPNWAELLALQLPTHTPIVEGGIFLGRYSPHLTLCAAHSTAVQTLSKDGVWFRPDLFGYSVCCCLLWGLLRGPGGQARLPKANILHHTMFRVVVPGRVTHSHSPTSTVQTCDDTSVLEWSCRVISKYHPTPAHLFSTAVTRLLGQSWLSSSCETSFLVRGAGGCVGSEDQKAVAVMKFSSVRLMDFGAKIAQARSSQRSHRVTPLTG